VKKDDAIYFRHVYDCIGRIKEYVSGGRSAFFGDRQTQDAVIRNLEVIGQAVKDLGTDDLTRDRSNVPWSQVAAARNVLALWRQEVVNAIWQAQKRRNITADAASTAVELLAKLNPVIYEKARPVRELFDLCRAYDLSAYDATYLGLARDLNLPIACKDGPLKLVLRAAGVKLA